MIRIGEVTIHAIVEADRVLPSEIATLAFPAYEPERLRPHAAWLEPDHVEESTGALRTRLQSFVIRTPHRTVLVDTGYGDDKHRSLPGRPPGIVSDQLHPALRRAGFSASDIDAVVATHIHVDHVGGNTRRAGAGWVPAFPRADYFIGAADVAHWAPGSGPTTHPEINPGVFDDSIAPLMDAGVLTQVRDALTIDDHVLLVPSPGHTPGTLTVRVTGDERSALLVGDIIHHAMQLPFPDWHSGLDEDPAAATRVRRMILEAAATDQTILIPSHLSGSGAVSVMASQDGYLPNEWFPLVDRGNG